MNIVEKVARAIHEKAYETRGSDRMPDWTAVAKAAIEAMREPTEEMKLAGSRDPGAGGPDPGYETEVWQAMIDEALSGQQTILRD